jgi:hypothetical protein
LAKKGFDPLMGARPMQRLIQDMIRRALADELLFGRLTDGGRLTVDLDDKEEVLLDIQPLPKKENRASKSSQLSPKKLRQVKPWLDIASGPTYSTARVGEDEKRGKVWTRVIREIMVAARTGGADLSANPRLRLAIEKAKAANMPADTIKRNIDKATGNLEGVHYEEIRYEGYGVGGVALIVDTMTDNKFAQSAEVRHALSKHGGNLGTEGSVAFQFKHCGQLILAPGTSEDAVMEAALDAGAEDVSGR